MEAARAEEQTASNILMIRPASFGFNAETAETNPHQDEVEAGEAGAVRDAARKEVDAAAQLLRDNHVTAIVIDDTEDPVTPDAVFPNNWMSTHPEGVVLYPMLTPNRRAERRRDIVTELEDRWGFKVGHVQDLSRLEEKDQILEGTGSLVLDRDNRVAYAALSPRTDESALQTWGHHMGYDTLPFHTQDIDGKPVYHTNVVMSMGSKFAILCAEAIAQKDRNMVLGAIEQTGREIITITPDQMAAFAGNALEVRNNFAQQLLVMSDTAHESLTEEQIRRITAHNVKIISSDVSTIEKVGGGSMRCMMAEIHLPEAV